VAYALALASLWAAPADAQRPVATEPAVTVEAPAGEVQPAPKLPDAVRRMIESAVELESGTHLNATVQLAIEAVPEAREEILALVAERAPGRLAEVTAALDSSGAPDAVAVSAVTPEPAVQAAGAGTIEAAEPPVTFWSMRGFAGKFALGGSRNTGNTEEEAINAALELKRKHGRWTYDFDAGFDFQTSEGDTIKQRLDTALEVNFDIAKRFYTFSKVQYEDDRFSGFQYRLTGSAGLGWRVLIGEKVNWSLEAGPGVRYDVRLDTGEGQTLLAARTSSDFAWKISDSALFEQDTEAVIDGGTNVVSTTALKLKVTERWSGQLSYEVRLNTDPPPDTEDLDTTARAAIVYDF